MINNKQQPTKGYFDHDLLIADHNKLRLFCFPYAGGSAAIYRSWPAWLDSSISLCPVLLPGRGTRLNESPIDQIDCLINALFAVLADNIDKPYAFFGHSMGGLVAFELAKKLHQAGLRQPEHLFVSGRQAPHLSRKKRNIHDLPDNELKQAKAST
ncbi:thioesterase II family protein [Spartinivicinus ruber]|uniref:thioesterase II family protein n=1 Tax=Spartinivicinus ruber TaxID=2683272 RepID=UPI0013D157F1|nr:thioesterase [Spartinivicinus ruber]